MEIPPDILEELKCSECEGYLSRGPVYLQHDGAAVCGVCFSPKRQVTRNKQYEATAKLLLFPCKNRDLGCQHTVPFVKEAEITGHEEVCEYRKYVCPIVGSARCDWVGTRTDILKHCEENHADNVKDNPTTLTHDISKSSEHTFLLQAFQLLFLLHVKICVTPGKIFHAIRYLGRSEDAKKFTFKLNIKRNDDEQVMRKGQVAPQGCLSIQEDSSLAVHTNSLLEMLGGFDGTTFTITVERLASTLEKCAKCNVLMTSFIYREGDGWWCERCSPGKEDCMNKAHGCTFTDISVKGSKHNLYFCEKTVSCKMCENDIPRDSLFTHYDTVHEIEKYNSGFTWKARWTGADENKNIYDSYYGHVINTVTVNKGIYYLLSSIAGIGMCKYWLEDTKLSIHVFIPVISSKLSEFKCVVRITQTATGQTRNYTPDIVYNQSYDWIVEVEASNKDFTDWSHEFDVCVNIIKIGP